MRRLPGVHDGRRPVRKRYQVSRRIPGTADRSYRLPGFPPFQNDDGCRRNRQYCVHLFTPRCVVVIYDYPIGRQFYRHKEVVLRSDVGTIPSIASLMVLRLMSIWRLVSSVLPPVPYVCICTSVCMSNLYIFVASLTHVHMGLCYSAGLFDFNYLALCFEGVESLHTFYIANGP
jgi:hypothetical protein